MTTAPIRSEAEILAADAAVRRFVAADVADRLLAVARRLNQVTKLVADAKQKLTTCCGGAALPERDRP